MSSSEIHHANESASPQDVERVRELIGRTPSGDFTVVVRDRDGDPVVIRNAPFLHDGTPMPTRYWLVGRRAQEAVGRLESTGAVRQIEALFDPSIIAATHERYAKERESLIDPDYAGPHPTGGVGGTRRGLKCLHAHLAWYLAGGADPIGRYVAILIGEQIGGSVAAIDCGTNSTRLLILSEAGEILAREMTITRLGEGVDTTKRLNPKAIERTLVALGAYREILDRHGVVMARATTTSAARDAENREELFASVQSILGFELELLSGEEEGTLSYLGATAGVKGLSHPALVIDVGGGSTEFAAGSSSSRNALVAVATRNMGCVRITERFLHTDPPAETELDEARISIAEMIIELQKELPALSQPRVLVAVAGTIATLATRACGLDVYEGRKTNGTTVTRSFVESEIDLLSKMTADQRRKLAGIEIARADVIVGGLLIVQQILELFGFDELVYSESDILDGLAANLLERQNR
jgi:exopolyphosphatase/guanosine-5'-triphosphate,3'-diphosphate pyrophosphatase